MGTCQSCNGDEGYEVDASELKFIFQPGVYRVDAPVRVKESMEPGSRCITLLDENMTVNLLTVTDTHIEIDSPVHGFLPMVNPRTGLCTLDMDNIVALDAGYVEPRNSCEIPVKTSKMKLTEFSDNQDASRQPSGPTQPSRTETIVCDDIPFKKRVPEKNTAKTSDTRQNLDEVLVCSNTTPESGSPVKTSEPAEKKTPDKKNKSKKTKNPEEDLTNVKRLRRVSGFGGLKYFEGEKFKKVKKKRKVKKIVAGYKLKYWTKPIERKESDTLIALRQNSRKFKN